jgi:hypothetical protein
MPTMQQAIPTIQSAPALPGLPIKGLVPMRRSQTEEVFNLCLLSPQLTQHQRSLEGGPYEAQGGLRDGASP